MNAREVIANAVEAYFSDTLDGGNIADVVLERMEAAGFTIMSKEDVEAIREALRGMFCPRPCNNRPDQFDVGDCFDAGECGCIAGPALQLLKSGGRKE